MEIITINPDDYTRMSFVDFNRDVDFRHVQTLKDSITRYGFISPPIAIEVGERLEIVDGQHRVTAAMELHVDIPIYVISGVAREDMPGIIAKLNTTSKRWALSDYFSLYVRMKETAYLWLADFLRKSHLSLNTALYLWTPNPLKSIIAHKSSSNLAFRNGQWEPSGGYKKNVDAIMATFYKVKEAIDDEVVRRSISFSDALLRLILHPNFNLERFLANLEHVGYFPDGLHNVHMHFETLVSIYNRVKKGSLSFDYQLALDNTVVTSEKQAQIVRDRYVDVDQFAQMSPYSISSVKAHKKLQPNNGVPDLKKMNKKYWKIGTATRWADGQNMRHDSFGSISDVAV